MGFRSLNVRFLAGLELYVHLDSTNFRRASLATSSDTEGTLQKKHCSVLHHRFTLFLRTNEHKPDKMVSSSADLTLGTEVLLLNSGWGL